MAENENAESEDEQFGSSTVHSGTSASEAYTGDDSEEKSIWAAEATTSSSAAAATRC